MLSALKKFDKIAIVLIFLFLFLTFLIVRHENIIKPYDIIFLSFIQSTFHWIPINFAIILSDLGYEAYMIPNMFVVSLWLIKIKKLKEMLLFVLFTFGAEITAKIVKEIISRPRPDEMFQKIIETNSSFPSGHSTIVMAFYSMTIFLILKFIKNKTLKYTIVTILTLYVLFVGLSRMILGVHYITNN